MALLFKIYIHSILKTNNSNNNRHQQLELFLYEVNVLALFGIPAWGYENSLLL